MYSQLLPLSLVILLTQFASPVWSQATLVPPSTFPSAVLPSSSASRSSVSTSRNSSTTTGPSGSSSASLTPTLTSSTQYPSLTGVPSCVSNCLATAISRVGCSSVIDVNCFCVNSLFSPELVACIEADCPDQLDASENLAQQFCNVASSSVSLSFAPVPSTILSPASDSVTTSSATTPPTTSASTTASSTATRNTRDAGQTAFVALTISGLAMCLGVYATF